MFTLKTKTMTMQCTDKPLSITCASDSVYVKLKEGTEIIIPAALSETFKSCLNLIQTSTAPNITVDLMNPKQPVSFS